MSEVRKKIFLLFFLLCLPNRGLAQEGAVRSRFHWDVNTSILFSVEGQDLAGFPYSHVVPTNRAPRNYVGFDWFGSLEPESKLYQFFGSFPLTTWSLNPHIEIDFNPWETLTSLYYFQAVRNPQGAKQDHRTFLPDRGVPGSPFLPEGADFVDLNEKGLDFNFGDNTIRVKPVIYDAWIRFEPKGLDRAHLRVGHFPIPYGLDPALASRGGEFIAPVENTDLGFKRDWGLAWKAPLGPYEYTLAATTGMGLGIHDPHWFSDDRPASYLFSARIGLPSYMRRNYGLSGLFGKVATFAGDHLLQNWARQRWRVNFNFFQRIHERFYFIFESGFGKNEDARGDGDNLDEWVFSGQIRFDYIPSQDSRWKIKWQMQSVLFDLRDSEQDFVNTTLEASYAFSSAWNIRFSYVHDFRMPEMVDIEDQRVYLSLNYYQ